MLRRIVVLFILMAMAESSGLFAQAKPTQPPAKQEDDKPPAMAVPPTYKFDLRGRRDPFVNPVPKPVENKPLPLAQRPPGLAGVVMAEVTITAIVVSKQAPELTRAAITTPDKRTYAVRKGDKLYDAVVKDIQRDAVVFELTSKDKDGKITTREVVRKIRSTP